MRYSGAGVKLIHKKTRSKKSRDTVPLRHLHKLTCAYISVQKGKVAIETGEFVDLPLQKTCKFQTKLVPKLTPQNQCTLIPQEVCTLRYNNHFKSELICVNYFKN